MTEEERYGNVRHCKYANEVFRNAPWILTPEFVEKNKIDFIAHDDIPYPAGNISDIYAPFKEKGMFLATERTEGISTSDIVARIVRDYDVYLRRNIARGYSAKDLNISFLNEKKIKFQNKMHQIKDKSKQVLDTIGERKGDILTKWEEKSRELIDNFLLMFKKNGLKSFWNGSKDRIMQAISPPGSREPSPGRSTDESPAVQETTRKRRRYR